MGRLPLAFVLVCFLQIAGAENINPGAVITEVSPRYGSLGGGTVVALRGQNLAVSAFAMQAGGSEDQLRVQMLRVGLVETELYPEGCSDTQITFITKHSTRAGPHTFYVTLGDKSIPPEAYCAECTFEFVDERTPIIRSLLPQVQSLGGLLTIGGRIFTNITDETSGSIQSTNGITKKIQRVYVGGNICDMYSDETHLRYGVTLDEPEGFEGTIICQIKSRNVGCTGPATLVLEEYGVSITENHLKFISTTGQMCTVQVTADIQAVSANEGSVEGGTRITIQGTNLDSSTSRYPLHVYVGDQEAEVESADEDGLVILTPPLNTDDDRFAAFAGTRGVFVEVGPGTRRSRDPTLNVQETHIVQDFEFRMSGGLGIGRMYSYFVPPVTDDYSFYPDGSTMIIYLSQNPDDPSDDVISRDPAAKREIISIEDPVLRVIVGETPHTEPIRLIGGQKYYLEAYFRGNDDWIARIGIRQTRSPVNHATFEDAVDTQNRINIRAAVQTQRQSLDFSRFRGRSGAADPQVVTLTMLNSERSTFTVCANQACTGALYNDISPNALKAELLSLGTVASRQMAVGRRQHIYTVQFKGGLGTYLDVRCTGQCQAELVQEGNPDGEGIILGLGDRVSPLLTPTASADEVKNAILRTLNKPCSSLLTSTDDVIYSNVFETPVTDEENIRWATGEEATDAFCGSRVSAKPDTFFEAVEGVYNVIAANIYKYMCFAYNGNYRASIKIYFKQSARGAVQSSNMNVLWDRSEGWHYTCANLYDHLRGAFSDGNFMITKMTAYVNQNLGGVKLDAVSIRKNPVLSDFVTEESLLSSGVAASYRLESLEVEKLDNGVFNIEALTADCAAMDTVVVKNDLRDTTTATVLQEGSRPITGTFDILWEGNLISGIPAGVDEDGLEQYWSSNVTDGRIHVEKTGDCYGASYDITFVEHPGAQTTISVDSDLEGNNVQVDVEEVAEGGILRLPIRGDATSTLFATRQIRAVVNGIPTMCNGDICGYSYSEALTPHVTDVSADSGETGDNVEVTMTGFDADVLSNNEVYIGRNPCEVTDYKRDMSGLKIRVGAAPLGTYPVVVRVKGKGNARMDQAFTFTVTPSVNSINPRQGGRGGGMLVTITGSGFNEGTTVMIDDKDCPVQSVTAGEIVCMQPPLSTGRKNVHVTTEGQSIRARQKFQVKNTPIPLIRSLSTTTVSAEGGTVITVEGQAFGEVWLTEQPTLIGDKVCGKGVHTDNLIEIITPPLDHGEFELKLFISGEGYAATRVGEHPVITVVFEVNGVTPDKCSSYGGCHLTITGQGLAMEQPENYDIRIGRDPCEVETATDTEIVCFLDDTSKEHIITNGAADRNYGEGFKWDHLILEVEVNDQVIWRWNAPPHVPAARYNVEEVDAPGESYNGGFISPTGRSAQGAYRKRFIDEGIYHYTSTPCLPMNDFQFYGQIRVVPKEAGFDTLSVEINGISAHINAGSGRSRRSAGDCEFPSSCAALPSNGALGISMLPCLGGVINAVDPLYGTTASAIGFRGSNILTDPSCINVSFGDYACDVVGDVQDDGENQSFSCNVNTTPDGLEPMTPHQHYPISVSQGTYGYALLNQESRQDRHFFLRVAVFDVQPRQGSVSGGTIITITGEGFIEGQTEVAVDGYGCTVQEVTYTTIVCMTHARPAEGNGVVEAQVNEITSICEDTENECNFDARMDLTPRFTDFSPGIIRSRNTVVTLTGEGFGDVADDITVSLDGASCEILSVTDTEITCQALSAPGGQRRTATIRKHNIGYAVGAPTYNVWLMELEATPTVGSLEGNTLVTLTGLGFIPGDTEVMIGGAECNIETITYSELTCRTAPNSVEGEYFMSVGVRNGQFRDTPNYTYSNQATPVVSGIEPAEGPAGTEVVISGFGFEYPSEVMIGGVACEIGDASAVTENSITCTTGNHIAGEANVGVWVASKGDARSEQTFKYSFSIDAISPARGSHGGQYLVTLTGGGLGENMHVTVCGNRCAGIRGTPTQATCTMPPSGDISGDKECLVTGRAGTESDSVSFVYADDLTPKVEEVHPRRGGTGGGTNIDITGVNFGFEEGDISVSIGGAECIIISVADTLIKCDTGARPVSVTTNVEVSRTGYGTSVAVTEGADLYQYADVWSSRWTWGPLGIMPADEDMVVIPEGQALVVDMDTPLVKLILIQGGEMTFDQKDITLRAENILITNGGRMEIGRREDPFVHNAVIEMYGRVRAPEIPIYGAKGLGLREGTIDMHGIPVEPSWSLLDATAEAGSTQLVMQQDLTNWNEGDKIAIASTGDLNSQNQNEVRTIVSVARDRRTITVDEPLEHRHLGTSETYGDTTIQLRAEVALLSRNIKFVGKGDPTYEVEIAACPDGFNPGQFATQTCHQGRFGAEMGSDQYGAHILVHNPVLDSQLATLRLSNVELNYVGQAYRIGRYPIHFHFNGDMSNSFVRNCAIWKTFNRAFNVHNTHNLNFEGNTVWDVMGGAVFLEDGSERGNRLDGNFVGFVKASSSLRTDDITPAGFWITHPNNIITNNHVAGGTHFGFWYRMLEHPEGPSFNEAICPRNGLLGEFDGNVVHSVGWYGLWIMEDMEPKENEACHGAVNVPAVFKNFVAWNSLRGAEAVKCGAVHFKNFVVANNDAAGLEWLHITGTPLGQFKPSQGPVIEDAVIIAYLENSDARCTKRGLVLPFESGLVMDGVKFYNFDGRDNEGFVCTGIGLVKIGCQCSQLCGAFRYEFSGVEWNNSPRKAYPEWEHMWWLVDKDGSFTGTAGASVVAASGSYHSSKCRVVDDWGTDEFPGMVCDPDVQFARMAFNRYTPHDGLHGLNLHVTTEWGTSVVPHHTKGVTHRDGWFMVLMTGTMNKFSFPDAPAVAEVTYSAGVYDLQRGDHLLIGHVSPRPVTFNTLWMTGLNDNLMLPTDEPLSEDTPSGNWHYEEQDDGSYLYSYIVSDRARTKEHVSRIWSYKIEGSSCIDPSNCADIRPSLDDAPEVPENQIIRVAWDDPNAWNTGSDSLIWHNDQGEYPQGVPQEGAFVTIPPNFEAQIYERSPPPLTMLEVLGDLTFRNDASMSFELTTKYLYISGSVTAGEEDHEFQGDLTFNLVGEITDEDYPIVDPPTSDGIEMGVKAIGVYGDLRLYGKSHNHVWVKLAETVEAGTRRLYLEECVDWEVGSQILVTPTSYQKRESEIHTIREIEEDGCVLVLRSPLEHRHISGEETLSNGLEYSIKGEVALLTRNIKIQSAESEDDFGGRVVVGTHTVELEDQPGYYQSYMGTAVLSNVEFYRTGQFGLTENTDPRFSLAFVGTGSYAETEGLVENCSFWNGYSTHIGLFDCEEVEIKNNILHGSHKTSLEVHGKHIIEDNLIAHCRAGTNDPTSICVDLRAFDPDSTFNNNVIVGAQRMAVMYPGEHCPNEETYNAHGFSNNEIRSSHYGVGFFKQHCGYEEGRPCSLVRGWTFTRMEAFGLYYSDACNLEVVNNTFIDNTIGSLSFVAKPSILEHEYDPTKYMIFEKNLLVGHSPWLDCDVDRVQMNSEDMYETGSGNPFVWHPVNENRMIYGWGKSGFVVPTFTHKPVLAPGKTWILTKCYPAINGQTHFLDNTAVHFGASCAGSTDYVIASNPSSLDVQHPVYISRFTNIGISRRGLYYLGQPNPDYIQAGYCGDLECDGPKKLLIKDEDCSFLGCTGSASIIPQSERAWDAPGMRNRGLGDSRIPTVMQTDVDGNRIPMDEVRPRLGIERPLDAEFVGDWPGYIVQGTEYVMVVFESLDHEEFLTRRPGPLVIRSSTGRYVDVINGPRNYQLCEGYPCNYRPAIYYALCAVGDFYDVFFTSDPPANLRVFLINANTRDWVGLNIYFANRMRMDVYYQEEYQLPLNARYSDNNLLYSAPPQSDPGFYYRLFRNAPKRPGLNIYDQETHTLSFIAKGFHPIECLQTEVRMVEFGYTMMDETEVFSENTIMHLASILGVPLSNIRVVNAVSENSRRRRAVDGVALTIDVELGPGPQQTAPDYQYPDLSGESSDSGTSGRSRGRREALKSLESIQSLIESGELERRLQGLGIVFLGEIPVTTGTSGETPLTEVDIQTVEETCGGEATMLCGHNEMIRVRESMWGNSNGDQAACESASAESLVSVMCSYKQNCTVTATSDYMGDAPCTDTPNCFSAQYDCVTASYVALGDGIDVQCDSSLDEETQSSVVVSGGDSLELDDGTAEVIGWKIYTLSTREIQLQVWDLVGENQYSLVGGTTFQPTRPGYHIVRLDEDDFIENVPHGAVVGLTWYDGASVAKYSAECSDSGPQVMRADAPDTAVIGRPVTFTPTGECATYAVEAIIAP